MNKNLVLYGLIGLGGVLAYYAWKQNSLSAKANSKNTTTPLSQTSGVFVDDVPIDPSVLGFQTGGIKSPFLSNINNSISQIIEPFIGRQKQPNLSGKGQFIES
jgi:hypothetical protein